MDTHYPGSKAGLDFLPSDNNSYALAISLNLLSAKAFCLGFLSGCHRFAKALYLNKHEPGFFLTNVGQKLFCWELKL